MNQPVLIKINETLSTFPEIKVAVLYGSFANGTENPKSDIDLALAASKKIPPEELVEIQTRLSNSTGREVDLIDLNTACGTVFKEALTKGSIILKRDPALYAQILSRMLFEQADFEPLRNRIFEDRRKRVLG